MYTEILLSSLFLHLCRVTVLEFTNDDWARISFREYDLTYLNRNNGAHNAKSFYIPRRDVDWQITVACHFS